MLFHFDQDQLLRLAGDKAFARGKAYFKDGAVEEVDIRGGRYSAVVMGSQPYGTSLGWEHGLHGDCDCPAGLDGFCKHQVALGLAVLAMAADAGAQAGPVPAKRRGKSSAPAAVRADNSADDIAPEDRPRPENDQALVERWLSGLAQQTLASMVLALAESDRDHWRATVAQARAALSPPEGQRDVVKNLIGSPRFLDWRQTAQYARRLEPLFGMFEQQTVRDPVAALSLMLYALKKLLSLYEKLDDSSGALGDVGQRIGQTILRTAASMDTPAPKLASDVFAVLLLDDWETLHPLKALQPALGARGMARLQALAEKRLTALPVAKDRWGRSGYEIRHAQRLLDSLLEAQGDIDALIARKAKSLDSGYDYLKLAEACLEHDRIRQGIEWLERGIKHDPHEFRLHDRLAQVYVAEGFAQDAIALQRRAFEARPTAERHAALRQTALSGGDWPAIRADIDQWIAAHPKFAPETRLGLRIEYRLLEGDSEGAWALADGQPLRLHLLRALMNAIESTRPPEAVQLLKRLIESELTRSGNSHYRTATADLKRMVGIAGKHRGVAATVDAYLADLRQRHIRKTSLIKMMAGVQVPPVPA